MTEYFFHDELLGVYWKTKDFVIQEEITREEFLDLAEEEAK
jgi:hypothetical protein